VDEYRRVRRIKKRQYFPELWLILSISSQFPNGTMVAQRFASEGLLDNTEGQLKDIGTSKGQVQAGFRTGAG
jgi:hypothetical protein